MIEIGIAEENLGEAVVLKGGLGDLGREGVSGKVNVKGSGL